MKGLIISSFSEDVQLIPRAAFCLVSLVEAQELSLVQLLARQEDSVKLYFCAILAQNRSGEVLVM